MTNICVSGKIVLKYVGTQHSKALTERATSISDVLGTVNTIRKIPLKNEDGGRTQRSYTGQRSQS